MSDDIFKRRMETALNDAVDVAESIEEEREIALPPGQVGKMGLSLFNSRAALIFNDGSPEDLYDYGDFQEDDRRDVQ